MDPLVKGIIVITILGILNTIYLAYHAVTRTAVKCLVFPQEWCAKVQQSRYSKTFGVKNAYLGLGMLIIIFILTLLYSRGRMSFLPAYGVIAAGFAFSLYFLYIQAFILKAYCTWCVISFLVFTALFTLGSILVL